MLIQKINEKQNIFGDEIGFIEHWDFSRANLNEENRIQAITQVASICYQNPKALGSESLYNRLLAESKGLPSSSFEFVPILFDMLNNNHVKILENLPSMSNAIKYGERIDDRYVLTNYRALVYDFEQIKEKINKSYGHRIPEEQKEFESIIKKYEDIFLKHFNTEEECEIIKQHFKVFLYKVDLPTRSQMVRHRVSWQELSRRYVSGKKVPFDFYTSEKIKKLKLPDTSLNFKSSTRYDISMEDFLELSLALYDQAIKDGIKPQEARRIIPQAGYTQIWGAFMPKQLDNYFKLRLDETAQWEIRQTALAMQELIK